MLSDRLKITSRKDLTGFQALPLLGEERNLSGLELIPG
jgi:hypothetical protein